MSFVQSPLTRPWPARFVFAFVAACTIAKFAAMLGVGLEHDEGYTIVVSRMLALSYFDHPPLHQWIVHGFDALFGESRWTRAPFFVLLVATNYPLYRMTALLFGREAGLWAIFAFNATAYFVMLPDGYIIPDCPMLLMLASAGCGLAEIISDEAPPASRSTVLWLAAGASLGLAGLAKYAAAFAPIGLFGFLLFSPRHRHWLWNWRPYVGALLALAIFSPALFWNAEHQWISFGFQLNRSAEHFDLSASAWLAILAALGAQLASLTPWAGAPIVMGIWRAVRSRDPDSGERLLLWLALPTLILFTFMPLIGQNAVPHWFNSGWLFAFPLAGRWLSEQSQDWARKWGIVCAALGAVLLAGYVACLDFGPFNLIGFAPFGLRDPTLLSFDWIDISQTPQWRAAGATPPDFVVVGKVSSRGNVGIGGKVGFAIGPKTQICEFSRRPREFAYECNPQALLGKDAMLVIPKEAYGDSLAELSPYFDRVDAGQEIPITRAGHVERIIVVARAHNLVKPYPLPYGYTLEAAAAGR